MYWIGLDMNTGQGRVHGERTWSLGHGVHLQAWRVRNMIMIMKNGLTLLSGCAKYSRKPRTGNRSNFIAHVLEILPLDLTSP